MQYWIGALCGIEVLFLANPVWAESPQESLDRINAETIAAVRADLVAGASSNSGLKAPAMIAKAKRLLLSELKDPDSAKFRNIRMQEADGAKFVCGEMNAKNSYGGYVGFTPFLTNGDTVSILATDRNTPYQINLIRAGVPLASSRPNPALGALCK
jgi:hypothetical protein